MNNLKTQGFILIDVDVAALNNAGTRQDSTFGNKLITKSIRKGGRKYVYVSGQAWRYWWRDTLEKQLNWNMSPIVRLPKKKVVFTANNPMEYPDDDIFGYMRADKGPVFDDNGNIKKNKKGEPIHENVSVTRVSPLKNSALVSVASVSTEENWSGMSRHVGDPIPYSKEEYSAIMKGMFALDISQAGTFSNYHKTGFKNLTDAQYEELQKQENVKQISDPFVKNDNGEAKQLVRLPKDVRTQRITDTLKALKFLSGGAMQTSNMADVAPKFIILSTMTVGNHPFTHIFTSGINKQTVRFNAEGLREVLEDYSSQFKGNIYIGVRNGFLDREDTNALEEVVKQFEHVQLKTVNKAVDSYCGEVEKLIE